MKGSLDRETMARLRVDLSGSVFKDSSITFDNSINYIYGRNGSGKSTLTRLIKEQCADDFVVEIFNGSEEISNNEYLEAIALGDDNKKILKELEGIEKNISDMTEEITFKNGVVNIASEHKEAKKSYDEAKNTIEKFLTGSASKIRKNTPRISDANYNKNSFNEDIKSAKKLSEENKSRCLTVLRATKKKVITLQSFPDINFNSILKSVIEIVDTIESPSKVLEEINSDAKKQFARDGYMSHAHKKGEICAFCGNEIKSERWKDLDSFFSRKIDKLEQRIKKGIIMLEDYISAVSDVKKLEISDYYEHYSEEVRDVNIRIEDKKREIVSFLKDLISVLKSKQKNLFKEYSNDISGVIAPEGFNVIKKECSALICKNNKTSANLSSEQAEAALLLRLDMAENLLQEFGYDARRKDLVDKKVILEEKERMLEIKKGEIECAKNDRLKKIEQMKDEKKIAKKINESLASIGTNSFQIEHIEDPEGKKGQYRVRGSNGVIRPISELSKGELNIVYFLYFIYKLSRFDKTKPTIIIFDDPMSSNDDTMQYLMISELTAFMNKFKGDKRDGCVIMMTHNCQFFLNSRASKIGMRHDSKEYLDYYKNNGYYHFLPNGDKTNITRITTEAEDFLNNYELLWRELIFLYNENKPTLMLNPARKICEAYCNFNGIDSNKFFGNNIAARKLLNVNQHSPYDFDAEQNGRTRDELLTMLKNVFEKNNAECHFDVHCHDLLTS